ncbi:MAG: peptide deformylase [Spirulina sp. SIO3F2]|nr:peptide deformylase [Spirulina sp. SIO3F2]
MPASVAVDKKKLENPPLDLHFLGDRVLRQGAKRVAKVDGAIRKLVREMLQTMYSSNGIGLAAPQVAVNKQVIVIDHQPDDATSEPLILVNPKIIRASKSICTAEEGCLSIPGVYLDVVRPEAIELTYKDENGRPQKRMADGLLARVIQHEMDHLDGVLFVDRVQNGLVLAQELKKNNFALSAVQPLDK